MAKLIQQIRAVFLKNVVLQKRRKIELGLNLFCPAMAVLVIGMLNFTIFTQKNGSSSVNLIDYSPNRVQLGSHFQTEYIFATAKSGLDLGYLPQNPSNHSGFLGAIPQFYSRWDYDEKNTTSPFAFTFPNEESLLARTLEIKKYFNDNRYQRHYDWDGEANTIQSFTLPVQSFSLRNLNNLSLDYKILEEIQPYLGNWISHLSKPDQLIPALSNAFLSYFNFNSSILAFSGETPHNYDFVGFSSADVIFTPLLTLALSFWLPSFVYNYVSEKEEKLFIMMKSMGLELRYYFLSTSIYHFVLILAGTFILVISGMLFQFGAFLNTGFFVWFLPIMGWALNMVSFSYFFQSFFSKGRTAMIVMNLINILTILIATALNFTIFNIIPIQTGPGTNLVEITAAHPLFLAYPPFAFCRALFLIGANCSFKRCLSDNSVLTSGEWPEILLVLYLGAPIVYLIAWYLDQVLPREHGVGKSPFFPILAIVRRFRQKRVQMRSVGKEQLLESNGKFEIEMDVELPLPALDKDDDVMNETKKVLDLETEEFSNNFSKYPIILKHLTKAYDDQVAVQDLSFAIEKNTCFGLLGPNGAGKTSLINCLTGFDSPTSGDAWICGRNIKDDMDGIYSSIGVCPQHDILWSNLTVEETLLFYIRMKGIVPMSRHEEYVQTIECLSHVSLQDLGTVPVSQLSGGMKRRLSVAVSLIGNPSVLFLDEPTTGLDIEVKRELWDILLQLKKEKAIILTTHSMEEADTLCNKIAIMTRGELKCIGANMYLKLKYGNGYLFKFQFAPENMDFVLKFVEKLMPKAVLEEKTEGQMSFRMNAEELDMGNVLQSILENKENVQIVDWGVSASSLDEVFLAIVKKDEQVPLENLEVENK